MFHLSAMHLSGATVLSCMWYFLYYIYIYIYTLYYFHFDFRYVTLDIYIYIYIYIICASTHNHNNEFILEFILRKTKMADFKCQQLEIQLEFVH